MSIYSRQMRCTGCDYKGLIFAQPITLVYQVPGGGELRLGREVGWCSQCDDIRSFEPDFGQFFEQESRAMELTRTVQSSGFRFKKMFKRDLQPEEQELVALSLGQKIARNRGTSPRCLTCETPGSGTVPLSAFTHSCGGKIIDDGPDDIRGDWVEDVRYVDFDGNKVGELGLKGVYVNLAAHLAIESVFAAGLYSGFLIHTAFDPEDFGKLLDDLHSFKA